MILCSSLAFFLCLFCFQQVSAVAEAKPQVHPKALELSWLCEEMRVPDKDSSKLDLDNFLWRKTSFYDLLEQLNYEQQEQALGAMPVRNKKLSDYVASCRTKIHAYHQSLLPAPKRHLKSLNAEISSLCHRMNSLNVLGASAAELLRLKTVYDQKLAEVWQLYPNFDTLYAETLKGCELEVSTTQNTPAALQVESLQNSARGLQVGIVQLLRQFNRGLKTLNQFRLHQYKLAEDEFFMLTQILDDRLISCVSGHQSNLLDHCLAKKPSSKKSAR